MDAYRRAGYRILEFSPKRKETLRQIAARLIPHQGEVLNAWVSQQWDVWQPPGLGREDLHKVFGDLLGGILRALDSGRLEACMSELAEAGSDLASRQFPFEALVISVHFLEKSYMPFLLDPPPPDPGEWLVGMDEFLHAALASVATAYFDAHRRELLEQAEVGRLVQEGLLAQIPGRTADLEVAHVYISAREKARLGGDFLDSFSIGPRGVVFMIGDLSGHGLEAAADSVMLRSLFRGFMIENPDLPEAMRRLNRVLESELEPGHYATALAVDYQMSGDLEMVCAGHPFPVLCDGDCRQLELGGPALAIDADSNYASDLIQLRPGAVFVAFTDGLSEARAGGELFGEDRVVAAVASLSNAPARAIAEHLIDESLRHAGGRFDDDVAVLVLKRLHD